MRTHGYYRCQWGIKTRHIDAHAAPIGAQRVHGGDAYWRGGGRARLKGPTKRTRAGGAAISPCTLGFSQHMDSTESLDAEGRGPTAPPEQKRPQTSSKLDGEQVDASASMDTDGDVIGYGTAFSGERFQVPRTLDMFESLCSRKNWGPGEVVVVAVNTYNFLTLALMRYIPTWYFILVFCFWRLSYNVGIGWILHHQSNGFGFDHWLQSLKPEWQVLLTRMAVRNLPVKGSSLPKQFQSWMVFRLIASMILSNDGQTYCILAVKLFQTPVGFGGWTRFLFCLVVGFALCYVAWHAKMNAHDTVGDYAWFWGDFWFKMEGELTFEGVFELVPHPMYTAGYLGYYGLCLITRSHTLLIVSLLAHTAQILFLVFVEEPHIQKCYGPQKDLEETRDGGARGVLERLFAAVPLRHVDVSLVAVVCYALFFGLILNMGSRFYIMQLLLWRGFHICGLYAVMLLQSERNLWMKTFASYGFSAEDAFVHWQRLVNLSVSMNNVSFLVVALRVPVDRPLVTLSQLMTEPVRLASFVGGCAAIALSLYVMYSVHTSIGSYGWYHGDLFLPPTAQKPYYEGLYRYMDNPHCLLGYLGYYGLALMTRSSLCFWVSLFSQALNYAFVHLVEVPHMRKSYQSVRNAAGIERLVRRKFAEVNEVPSVRKVTDKVKVSTVRTPKSDPKHPPSVLPPTEEIHRGKDPAPALSDRASLAMFHLRLALVIAFCGGLRPKDRTSMAYQTLVENVENKNQLLRKTAEEASMRITSRREILVQDARALRDQLQNHHTTMQARKVTEDTLAALDVEILAIARRAGLLADLREQQDETFVGRTTSASEQGQNGATKPMYTRPVEQSSLRRRTTAAGTEGSASTLTSIQAS